MIAIKNLSKVYGKDRVLDDITAAIELNKITAVIGANGSGKTTFLEIVARFQEATSGDVMIDGVLSKEWDNRKFSQTLSMLKQQKELQIRLTVKELVSFGRFPYSQGNLTDEDKEKIDKAMDYMDLHEMEDKYLDELSGGQLQRAYIAMIIAQDTKYIILDEPLNNLDIQHALSMMKTLRRLAEEEEKAIIMIIHDMNMVYKFTDNVIALKKGKLVCAGRVEEVLNEAVLKEIYNVEVCIRCVGQDKICVFR